MGQNVAEKEEYLFSIKMDLSNFENAYYFFVLKIQHYFAKIRRYIPYMYYSITSREVRQKMTAVYKSDYD